MLLLSAWCRTLTPGFLVCSLEISSKEMNTGADRMALILTKKAKEQQELNIWRQFGRRFTSQNGYFFKL